MKMTLSVRILFWTKITLQSKKSDKDIFREANLRDIT